MVAQILKEEEARDLFISQCLLGQRISDLPKIFKGEYTVTKLEGNVEVISFVVQKTGEQATVYLFPLVKEILNKYKEKTTLCREISEALPSVLAMFETTVFETKVRECEDCKKAQSARMGVQAYNAKCTTAKDYWNVCEEIVRRRA